MEKPKDWNAYRDEYASRFFCSIEGKTEKQKFAHNSITFLFCTLQRSKDLYSGVINCLSQSQLMLAYLAVRAHMETTGSIAYFLIKLMQFYDKQIEFEDLDTTLMRLHLGRRYYLSEVVYPEKPVPINVLTLIDTVDKVAKNRDKEFRDSYEWLSEFCHPNAFGKIYNVGFANEKTFFEESQEIRESDCQTITPIIEISCFCYFNIYDQCMSLLRKHEDIPKLIKEKTK